MQTRDEEENERLRNQIRKMAKPKVPKFIPYATMFKLESRPRPAMAIDLKPRGLQCVSCNMLLSWEVYTISPDTFDAACSECKVTAREFWKGTLHKEIPHG